LLVLATPLLLATALWLRLTRPGPLLFRRKALVIPEPAGTRRRTCHLWSFHPPGPGGELSPGPRSFLLVVLPGLVNIVRGEMSFAGVRPRSPEEVEQLSPEWRSFFLCCKAGLITEEASRSAGPHSDDERYAAEAYYAAAGDWRYDLRLVGRYLRHALLPSGEARMVTAA
jgi:lipopolysaccharide/colanic/teichoic acid biosynthesis glycosyltransferase